MYVDQGGIQLSYQHPYKLILKLMWLLFTKDSLAQLNPKTKKDFKQEGAGKQLLRCLFCALAGKGEHYYDEYDDDGDGVMMKMMMMIVT